MADGGAEAAVDVGVVAADVPVEGGAVEVVEGDAAEGGDVPVEVDVPTPTTPGDTTGVDVGEAPRSASSPPEPVSPPPEDDDAIGDDGGEDPDDVDVVPCDGPPQSVADKRKSLAVRIVVPTEESGATTVEEPKPEAAAAPPKVGRRRCMSLGTQVRRVHSGELPLVGVPDGEVRRLLTVSGHFPDDPLLHFVGWIDKANAKGKTCPRLLVVSTKSIYVLHTAQDKKAGQVARSVPLTGGVVTLVGSTPTDWIALHVPSEFDLLFHTEAASELRHVIQSLSMTLNDGTPVPTTVADTMEELLATVNLLKPSGWQPTLIRAESLVAATTHAMKGDETGTRESRELEADPRNSVPLVRVPTGLRGTFETTPFAGDPLLHFFSPCEKMNHHRGKGQRYCIVSHAAIYLCYTTGLLQRCISIEDVTRLWVGTLFVGLHVPSEFDTLIVFSEGGEAAARGLVDVLRQLKEFRVQQPLSCQYYSGGGNARQQAKPALKEMKLAKPRGWKPKYLPPVSTYDLVRYLREAPEPE